MSTMKYDTPRPITGIRRLAVVAAVLTLIATMFAGLSPAGAEIQSEDLESTWGVRGLKPSNISISAKVRAMVTIGDRVYVGGRFAEVVAPDGSSYDQSYIAAFDRSTGEWVSSFTPTLDGPVHSLAVSSDSQQLFVGGEFANANGSLHQGIVSLNPVSGSVIGAFDVVLGPTGQGRADVMALEVAGPNLIIGGEFNRINDTVQRRIGRVNATTGELDASFDPLVLNGQVLALEHSTVDGRIYLGGQFKSVDGNSDLRYFAALDSDGEAVSQPLLDDPALYGPPENINGYSIVEVGNTVFLGARSNYLFVLDRVTLNRKWHWGPEDDAWNIDKSWHSSDFQALEVFEGALYGGSHLRWIGTPSSNLGNGIADSRTNEGAPSNVVTRFDLAGEHDRSFLPMELKGSVWAMTDAGNGCLWMGGNLDVPGQGDWNLARMCNSEPNVPGQTHNPFYNTPKFIQQQYMDIYGRRASQAEIDQLIQAGAGDTNRSPEMVAGLLDREDLTASRQVTRIYLGLFERLPDHDGLQYWIAQRRAGRLTLETMIDQFLVSEEFANLVGKTDNRDFAAEVYRRVLNREPEKAGLDYWEDALDKGLARNFLVIQFTESAEFVRDTKSQLSVVLAYSSMVRRVPGNSAAQVWIDRLDNGEDIEALVDHIYRSSEYRNRIFALPTSRP